MSLSREGKGCRLQRESKRHDRARCSPGALEGSCMYIYVYIQYIWGVLAQIMRRTRTKFYIFWKLFIFQYKTSLKYRNIKLCFRAFFVTTNNILLVYNKLGNIICNNFRFCFLIKKNLFSWKKSSSRFLWQDKQNGVKHPKKWFGKNFRMDVCTLRLWKIQTSVFQELLSWSNWNSVWR